MGKLLEKLVIRTQPWVNGSKIRFHDLKLIGNLIEEKI